MLSSIASCGKEPAEYLMSTRDRPSCWATLAIFAVEQILLVGTLGYSIGHRVAGIHVVRRGGGAPGPLAALVRALLLCLVIPAVIFDPDHRGLHDKAMNTLLIRR